VIGLREGVRSVDIRANKVSTTNILLACVKDLTYRGICRHRTERKVNWAVTACDLLPRQTDRGGGTRSRQRYPDYPDGDPIRREINGNGMPDGECGSHRSRSCSGSNRLRLLAHREPPNDSGADWQKLGLQWRHDSCLAGTLSEQPLHLQRIAIGLRFDTEKSGCCDQATSATARFGIAGTGKFDIWERPRMT